MAHKSGFDTCLLCCIGEQQPLHSFKHLCPPLSAIHVLPVLVLGICWHYLSSRSQNSPPNFLRGHHVEKKKVSKSFQGYGSSFGFCVHFGCKKWQIYNPRQKSLKCQYMHVPFPLQCWHVIAKLCGYNNIAKGRGKQKGSKFSSVSSFLSEINCRIKNLVFGFVKRNTPLVLIWLKPE